MKKILFITIIICMTTIRTEAFDWTSALNFIGKASETQTEQTQLNNLNDLEKQMATIDNSVQNAFVNIVSAISGWRETKNIKSQLKSENSALSEVISTYTNTYLANNKQSIINNIKKMSTEEKTELINNFNILTESGQNYLLLAANGAKAATNAFKTAQTVNEVTTTITNVNKTAAELKTKATSVKTLLNQLKSIATAAGIKVN